MQELRTAANLVDYATLEGGRSITAVLPRSQIESALYGDDSAQLWFELEREEDDQAKLLTIDMVSGDLEEMLRRSTGDEVVLALDGDAVAGMFDDPDVEAHGMRGALAIAVTTAAIVAPAGLAATPQTASAAATAQTTSVAATSQQAGLAATAQVSSLAAKAQISGVAAKTQVSKSLVVKAGGVTLLRGGIAQ